MQPGWHSIVIRSEALLRRVVQTCLGVSKNAQMSNRDFNRYSLIQEQEMKGKKAITTVFAVIPAIAALFVCTLPVDAASAAAGASVQSVQLSAETLADKIHGGLLGQLLGNLNGLKHEMKYINQPGNVEHYTPGLPDGARTDDDTDIEWVYIVAMQRSGNIFIPPQKISRLWKSHINHHIWCSNNYARQLMEIGIDPPLTGCIALNPWAEFNISGQFLCESFGLIAPGMPQTAARIGLHYTHVGIEGEPAQTTQLFTTMIASAFITDDMENILNAGFAAVDPESEIRSIVADVRRWHRQHRLDWRTTRRLIKQKYSRHNGAMRDKNGYELNTAATISALLYGKGDFVETLRTAFNFGWDADNNAATAATIAGVIKGHRWMQQQGWNIQDCYRNTTREEMPKDETISSFANRLFTLADRLILERGGQKYIVDGQTIYQICLEKPANIEPLPNPADLFTHLRTKLKPEIDASLTSGSTPRQQARAAYLAICLDLAETSRKQHPDQWSGALAALNNYPGLLKALFDSPTPAAAKLRTRASAVGIKKPQKQKL